MRPRARLALAGSRSLRLLAAAAAAVLLLVAAETASARNLRVSEQAFRVVWREMSFVQNPSRATLRCPITLQGSFQSASFFKVRGSQVGQITRSAFGTCTGDTGFTVRTLNETLPWSVKYRNFRGRLPIISTLGIDIIGLGWQTNLGGVLECLFRATTEQPASEEVRLETRPPVDGRVLEWTTEEAVSLRSSTLLCEEQTFLYFGVGTMTRPGSTTGITVSLI